MPLCVTLRQLVQRYMNNLYTDRLIFNPTLESLVWSVPYINTKFFVRSAPEWTLHDLLKLLQQNIFSVSSDFDDSGSTLKVIC